MGFLSERDVSMRCRAVPYMPLRSAQLWPVAVQVPVRRDEPAPDLDCPRCIAGRKRCIARRALLTIPILTVGVELSSVVVGLEVDLGLVNEADDHDVVVGGDVLDTEEGTVGDDAGAMALLGAPGDLVGLGLADGIVLLGGRPQAEV